MRAKNFQAMLFDSFNKYSWVHGRYIDDILHKDAGCGSELDYVEQTSWILFLKYLEDLEYDKQTAAELS